ncbi:MAG: metalloregulator ArsR/SmtB family transcription factor [Thermoplasmata archaeon]|nr:metalloregulator ArsR/SmtB family transcription factor [Thermoplasmata archaeon]
MAKRNAVDLDAVFAALAHPIRRGILERLAGGSRTVNELAAPYQVRLPTISRHLSVLEAAGLVHVDREGRARRRRLDAAPLSLAFGWLTRYRVLWEDRLDRFGSLVEVQGATLPTRNRRRKTKR